MKFYNVTDGSTRFVGVTVMGRTFYVLRLAGEWSVGTSR